LSVLVFERPMGSHKAIAIEPSSQNFAKLKNKCRDQMATASS